MRQPGSPMLWLVGLAAVLLSACSGASTPTPTTSPTPTPSPSPTALPPDTMAVGVLGLGVGTFDLAAFPVASLKNEATYHGALGVKVHFVTHKGGKTLGSLELGGGQSRTRRDPGRQRGLHRRLQRGDQRRRHRDGWFVVDEHRSDLHHQVRRVQLSAVPLRSWLRQRDRDAHTVIHRVIWGSRGGVRRLREQGRRDPRRWLRGVHLAVGIDPFSERAGGPQRRSVLLRARGFHRLVGSVRSV